MKFIKKHGLVKSRPRFYGGKKVHRVILHHTVGGSSDGAIATLRQRGLGYHYLIKRDGTVIELVPAERFTSHAAFFNRGSVGISYIGGGRFGYATQKQINATIRLVNHLKERVPLDEITGHKHASRSGKIDPTFKGEPSTDVNWKVDRIEMERIAGLTKLKFVDAFDLTGRKIR